MTEMQVNNNYTVKKGDSYWKIFKDRYGVAPTEEQLNIWCEQNGFDKNKLLQIGQELKFKDSQENKNIDSFVLTKENKQPPKNDGAEPTIYVVVKGDTFTKIAQKTGISRHVLMYYNKIDEEGAKKLQIGQKIKIPPKVNPRKISQEEKNSPEFKAQASAINAKLEGKLKDKGELITEICRSYDVDPLLLTAMMMQEVGRGNKVNHKNNFIGIKDADGKFAKYATLRGGIEAAARQLRNYNDAGLKTPEQIGKLHCPVGSNEKHGELNQYWVGNTTKFYNELQKACKN